MYRKFLKSRLCYTLTKIIFFCEKLLHKSLFHFNYSTLLFSSNQGAIIRTSPVWLFVKVTYSLIFVKEIKTLKIHGLKMSIFCRYALSFAFITFTRFYVNFTQIFKMCCLYTDFSQILCGFTRILSKYFWRNENRFSQIFFFLEQKKRVSWGPAVSKIWHCVVRQFSFLPYDDRLTSIPICHSARTS